MDKFDQDMVIEQDIVLTIGDQQHTLPKGTPIKVSRQTIDDHVKLELLDKYIEFAEDPLARDQPGGNARSKARNQLRPIWENHHDIKLKNGKYMRIKDLNLDNLSSIFAKRGFDFQGKSKGGLYWLVDSYFEHIEEEPNKERIRQLREDFITWVKSKLGFVMDTFDQDKYIGLRGGAPEPRGLNPAEILKNLAELSPAKGKDESSSESEAEHHTGTPVGCPPGHTGLHVWQSNPVWW